MIIPIQTKYEGGSKIISLVRIKYLYYDAVIVEYQSIYAKDVF